MKYLIIIGCIEEIDGVRVRGDGVVLIAVSGLDLLGNSVVQKLADVLCSREDLILQQSTIHLLPSLPTEHVLYLKVIFLARYFEKIFSHC